MDIINTNDDFWLKQFFFQRVKLLNEVIFGALHQ